MTMGFRSAIALALLLLCGTAPAAGQTQEADPNFDPAIVEPIWQAPGPVVVIDEAHANFHTADGRYQPFAKLLRADGYRVVVGRDPFSPQSLQAVDVLVVANAGAREPDPNAPPLFTDAEADALRDWVAGGGALLLIADHSPFGAAAQKLAGRFGIEMGEGWVFDAGPRPNTIATQFLFSRENGRLGDHPITRGGRCDDAVQTVRAFTGQSLSVPAGATALMILAPTAREAPGNDVLQKIAEATAAGAASWEEAAAPHSRSVGGRAQGLAMRFGAGRIVVLGEAAMLSAQVVTLPTPDGGERTFRIGMNVPDIDNRQFAINVMRWLSGALD